MTPRRRDCRFSSVTSRGQPAKTGVERPQKRSIDAADGDDFEADAEILGQGAGVGDAAFRGVGAGHADADDVFAADGVDGDGGGQRGIDAAAQADQDALEAALVNVIARAEDERFVNRFALIGKIRVQVAGAGCRVSAMTRSSRKEARGGDGSAFGVHGEAGAVEDELIVAADLIDVDDRNS